jgi:minor fimbrial subunit
MKWTIPMAAGGNAGLRQRPQAADVTITVNGKVVAKPCTVSTVNATVDLGDLYTFSLVSPAPLRPGTAWRSI